VRLLLILLGTALLPGLCAAQDDSTADNTIHAITALHPDGSRTVTITNPDNHSSEASTYDAAKRLIEKIVYALDDNNQPVSGVVYTSKNTPAFKTVYKHDESNRITEEDDFTMADQLMRRFTYEFGPDGKLARVRAFDSQGNELQQTGAQKDERQSLPRVH
jgi:hypothetical protein